MEDKKIEENNKKLDNCEECPLDSFDCSFFKLCKFKEEVLDV